MKILLTADESAGTQTLRLLNNSAHQVIGVITPGGNLPMRRLAEKMAVPVLEPDRLVEPSFSDWIRSHEIDVILNVHLLMIIRPDIIAAASFGAFNLHPGPLPDYAGLHTPSWAIYHRARSYGVTLHWLDEKIDAGPIAYQASVPVKPDDTGFSLSIRCASTGLNLISKLLDDLSSDMAVIPRISQNLSQRRYYGKMECPQNGCIDWTRSAGEIDALIRAFSYSPYPSPWETPRTRCRGFGLEISSINLTGEICNERPGTVDIDQEGTVRIATSNEWIGIERFGIDGAQTAAGIGLKRGDVLE